MRWLFAGWLSLIVGGFISPAAWALSESDIPNNRYWYNSSCSGTVKRGTLAAYCSAVNGSYTSAFTSTVGQCKNGGVVMCNNLGTLACAGSSLWSDATLSCVTPPAQPENTHWDKTTGGYECNAGYMEDSGGACVEPSCSLGKVWNGTACVFPEAPPESCGIGQMPVVNGSGATVACTPVLDDDESCDYAKGYDSSGYFLCSDRKQDCVTEGGTHGYVDGVEVCIPGDYSPPTCASTETVVMTDTGFVCSTPSDVKPPAPGDTDDSPTENPDDKCDPKTSDCDGDGNTDDSDGDGTNDNGTDPTTGTDETGKTGEAASSASCNQAPVCSGGDPQVCALLRQSWEHMCRGSDLIEQADDNQRKVFEDSFAGKVAEFGSDEAFGVAVGEGVGVAGEGPLHTSQVGTWKGFVDSLVPGAGGCGSVTMELPSVAGGDWSISCDDTASIRAWLGWAMYLVTAFYLFMLVMRPMES